LFGVLLILKLLGVIKLSWWAVVGIPIGWAFVAAGLNDIL
jgi:hypothetical protein